MGRSGLHTCNLCTRETLQNLNLTMVSQITDFFKEKCKQNKLVNRIVSKLNISTHIVEFVLRLNTLCILPWSFNLAFC